MPSSSSGTAISTLTPTSEPTNVPMLRWSKALTDARRNGPDTNGTTAISTAATSTIRDSPEIVGSRSASRPPIA